MFGLYIMLCAPFVAVTAIGVSLIRGARNDYY